MNKLRKKLARFALSVCLGCLTAAGAIAQSPDAKPTPPRARVPAPFPGAQAPPLPGELATTEKAIAVDPNAALKLCVLEGNLRINGWSRSEVRVFVKNGSKFAFKVLEKDPQSGKANWLRIMNEPGAVPSPGQPSECISGETVEIDVPVNMDVTVTGRVTQTTVDSIRKIYVKNVEGSIALRNITGGITALTYQGDITVENSAGAISLETTTGNIVAYEVNPGQIGDLLKAKTNSGAISLQRLEHRQIEASSITGSVLFNGKFLAGGIYNFKTSNGSIRLVLPVDSSMMVRATFGFGTFNSELPLTYLTENISPMTKTIVAKSGDGDASVNVTTSSGSIGIKKQ